MRLKGHTTFELTNVETGEQRVIEEDNLITNVYSELAKGMGVRGYSAANKIYDYSYSSRLNGKEYNSDQLKRFAGGLVLFEDALEEDADHMFMTGDDPEVTGVGIVDWAYTGTQTCAGSYNSAESGEIDNGYKYVWDFTTSQANGPIGCACLTSIDGAGIGMGLPTIVDEWYGTWLIRNGYKTRLPITDDYMLGTKMAYYSAYINEEKNTVTQIKSYFALPRNGSNATYTITNEYDVNGVCLTNQLTFSRSIFVTKSIDLVVHRLPFNNLSIFDKINSYFTDTRKTSSSGTSYTYNPGLKLLKTVTVPMPTELANAIPTDIVNSSNTYHWLTDLNFDEGFMYISFTIPSSSGTAFQNVNKNDKIYVWKINMETYESTGFTITNTTGAVLSYQYGCYFDTKKNVIGNNYTLLWDRNRTEGKFWTVENTNNANVKQIKFANGDPLVFDINNVTVNSGFTYKDVVYLLINKYDYTYIYKINMKTGIVSCGRGYALDSDYVKGFLHLTYGSKFPKFMYWSSDESYYYGASVYFSLIPMYLFTINNLTNKVQKTSAETMKVTYTLTEYQEPIEEPEEE